MIPTPSTEEADFGQSRFGHPDLTNFGQSNFGHSILGHRGFGRPILAEANFGQANFGSGCVQEKGMSYPAFHVQRGWWPVSGVACQ